MAMSRSVLCEPIFLEPGVSVRVEHLTYQPGETVPQAYPHFHEPAELIWFIRARGEVVTEIGSLPITNGTMLFLPAMSAHEFRLEDGINSWVVAYCDASALAADKHGLPDFSHVLVYNPQGAQRVRLAIAFNWLATLAAERARAADVLALASVLLREFPDAAATKTVEACTSRVTVGSGMHRLRPALELLAREDGQMVTMEKAAASCHLSPSYFSRAFSARFGIGFAEYARQYRLRAAARNLMNGSARISEIAYACGFVNTSHFSAAFQKRYGLSPSEFRKRQYGNSLSAPYPNYRQTHIDPGQQQQTS